MIKRDDFIFTVGYKGETAIVDGSLKSKFAKLTSIELAEAGLFKSAVSSALYNGDEKELERVLEFYNSKIETPLKSIEDIKKTFGVTYLPENISKVEIV